MSGGGGGEGFGNPRKEACAPGPTRAEAMERGEDYSPGQPDAAKLDSRACPVALCAKESLGRIRKWSKVGGSSKAFRLGEKGKSKNMEPPKVFFFLRQEDSVEATFLKVPIVPMSICQRVSFSKTLAASFCICNCKGPGEKANQETHFHR